MKAYQLKITLKNSKPPIWRRCIVPAGITFSGLAEIFTEVMGWSGCRLSEFEFYYDKLKIMDNCDEFKYNNPYYGCMEASETIINELLESNDWFSYIYDSEGRWQHRVTIEKIIDDYEYDYPQIVKYKGNCPPEDCGGIYKYYELMDALNDEKHPEHDEYAKWAAANGYPNQYDMDAVNVLLKAENNLKLIQADNCVGKAADRSDLIIMCFNAAEILYGIVPSRVIVEMYNNCCDCEEQYIDSKILKQELRRIPKEYINFEYVENQYVSVELLEDDSYNELLRYQRNKEFYIPGLSEIEQLYEYEYIADEPMLKRLQMFLVNKLGIEAAKAEACSGYAQRMVCDGYDMQEVLDFFAANDVLVVNEKQLKELIMLFNDFWNDTRMKINRGFKPNELSSYNKIRIVPEDNKDNIIDFEQRRSNKIYPNDLCPCGSGKKYKKCCGRNKNKKSDMDS